METQINMAATLDLSAGIKQKLLEQAARAKQTPEAYVTELVERDARAGFENEAGSLSQAKFLERLDELSAGLPPLPTLPVDWSRADTSARRQRPLPSGGCPDAGPSPDYHFLASSNFNSYSVLLIDGHINQIRSDSANRIMSFDFKPYSGPFPIVISLGELKEPWLMTRKNILSGDSFKV